MNKKQTIIIFLIVLAIFVIIPLIKIAMAFFQSGAYGIVGNTKYGKMETIKLLDNEVMSLYGKYGVNDIFGGNSYKIDENGIKGEAIVVFYKSPIDKNILEKYGYYLQECGFTKLESDKLFYVKNNDETNSFMFIIGSGAQIKYSAMYGRYEDYLDQFEL